MTGAQYKNVAQWTLSGAVAAEAADTVTVARAIFNNMGVAFPGGTCQEILLTLMSGDYMGWGECTYAQAQEFANAGVAAVGVDVDHVIVVLPDDSAVGLMDASAAPTAYARQTSDIPKTERMAMQFFAYGAGSSTPTATRPPTKTWSCYANHIVNKAVAQVGKAFNDFATGASLRNGIIFNTGAWCVDFVRWCCLECASALLYERMISTIPIRPSVFTSKRSSLNIN